MEEIVERRVLLFRLEWMAWIFILVFVTKVRRRRWM